MSFSGTAIFANDESTDIKRSYKDLLIAGLEDRAEEMLKEEYLDAGYYPTNYWITLAACEHQAGLLSDNVRRMATDIINRGDDLALWRRNGATDKQISQREQVLHTLMQQLNEPQKEFKRPSLPANVNSPWKYGDILLWEFSSESVLQEYPNFHGKFISARVVGIRRSKLNRYIDINCAYAEVPVLSRFAWCGDYLPAVDELLACEYIVDLGAYKMDLCLTYRESQKIIKQDNNKIKTIGNVSDTPLPKFIAEDTSRTLAGPDGFESNSAYNLIKLGLV